MFYNDSLLALSKTNLDIRTPIYEIIALAFECHKSKILSLYDICGFITDNIGMYCTNADNISESTVAYLLSLHRAFLNGRDHTSRKTNCDWIILYDPAAIYGNFTFSRPFLLRQREGTTQLEMRLEDREMDNIILITEMRNVQSNEDVSLSLQQESYNDNKEENIDACTIASMDPKPEHDDNYIIGSEKFPQLLEAIRKIDTPPGTPRMSLSKEIKNKNSIKETIQLPNEPNKKETKKRTKSSFAKITSEPIITKKTREINSTVYNKNENQEYVSMPSNYEYYRHQNASGTSTLNDYIPPTDVSMNPDKYVSQFPKVDGYSAEDRVLRDDIKDTGTSFYSTFKKSSPMHESIGQTFSNEKYIQNGIIDMNLERNDNQESIFVSEVTYNNFKSNIHYQGTYYQQEELNYANSSNDNSRIVYQDIQDNQTYTELLTPKIDTIENGNLPETFPIYSYPIESNSSTSINNSYDQNCISYQSSTSNVIPNQGAYKDSFDGNNIMKTSTNEAENNFYNYKMAYYGYPNAKIVNDNIDNINDNSANISLDMKDITQTGNINKGNVYEENKNYTMGHENSGSSMSSFSIPNNANHVNYPVTYYAQNNPTNVNNYIDNTNAYDYSTTTNCPSQSIGNTTEYNGIVTYIHNNSYYMNSSPGENKFYSENISNNQEDLTNIHHTNDDKGLPYYDY
uniref:GATA-type domain-containing protein n=1 Tax=Parastrongyloides trichosuri TaxID=131310 RepID=A0A0N5A469_PARTI